VRTALFPALLALLPLGASIAPSDGDAAKPRFVLPCDGYAKGLEGGKGNFGVLVTSKSSPFSGTWHLAEDVWLAAGTEVRAVADGIVRYSAFSPTWTDKGGHVHWNLGNVIVIEHALDPPIDGMKSVCSLSVHLAADRRVAVGDTVKMGQVIGRIGKGDSEENGMYPAHLHFGLHKGSYIQIPPSFERELRTSAHSKEGLQLSAMTLHGDITLRLVGKDAVLITETSSGKNLVLSLLVGSTAPKDPPPDIMCWCEGYGDKETIEEWLRPSTFLAPKPPVSTGGDRK
jgi:murein DD-endopeptidase MepM/ murein hydrolase activator NlpD